MPATPVWLAAVESLLNRSIAQSSNAVAAADRLNETSLRLDVEGFAPVRVAVSAGRIVLMSGGALGADAVVSGSPFALLDLFASPLQGSAAARNNSARDGQRLRISGDAEIAARYRELLALARPDWEEELARLVGDLPARRLSLVAQSALSWVRRFGRTAGENLAEYLQEESRDLASKPEIEEFLSQVDELRETADRVEARLARVEQQLKGRP